MSIRKYFSTKASQLIFTLHHPSLAKMDVSDKQRVCNFHFAVIGIWHLFAKSYRWPSDPPPHLDASNLFAMNMIIILAMVIVLLKAMHQKFDHDEMWKCKRNILENGRKKTFFPRGCVSLLAFLSL